ncbi:unnamed protein product, partial [Discosporangium mesarthrocarpum]
MSIIIAHAQGQRAPCPKSATASGEREGHGKAVGHAQSRKLWALSSSSMGKGTCGSSASSLASQAPRKPGSISRASSRSETACLHSRMHMYARPRRGGTQGKNKECRSNRH